MSKPAPKRRARKGNRGVLAYQQLRDLVHQGVIFTKDPIEERQYQPASLDLRLGERAYRRLGSFLPEYSTIDEKVHGENLFQDDVDLYEIDLRKGAVLEKGHVYIIPLVEEL